MKIQLTKGKTARLVMGALFCLLLLVLAMPAVHAQQYSGTITGTVIDPSGAAIAGAAVTATNSGTNASYSTTTSEQGVYSFAQLPVGMYNLSIKQGSFKEFVAKGVEVHVSTSSEVNAKLELGAASEIVTVEASSVQVQTASAEVGEVVQGTQVRELPLNGENFMNLVTLSPGVSTAQSFDGRDKGLTGGSDFSVNGNPYTNNLFLVDGVNNNDVGSNRTILVYPSIDAIAEFKMIRNSYGPEYGQASGAIISITTKSGENQFHGGLFYAGRNDKLDANDWFSNNNKTGKAELRRNDWGYNVSGPIKKDKIFFFWNQEWNREVRGESVSACVPTVAEKMGDFSADAAAVAAGGKATCGATVPTIPVALQAPGNPNKLATPDPAGLLLAQFYPDPNVAGATGTANNWVDQERTKPSWSEWNIRADYDVSKANRLTFRWTNDSWTSPSPNPNLFWGSSFFPTINSDWSQPSKSVMGKLTTQISSTMVNDVEFGYGHNAIITTLAPTGAGLVSEINAAIPSAWPASLKQAGAFINGGGNWGGLQPYGSGQTMWNIAPYTNHEDLYAIQDNISKVRGNHLFKFGVYYSTNAKDEFNNGGNDQPSFNTGNGGLVTCTASSPAGCVPGTPTGNSLANILVSGQQFVSTENSVNGLAQVVWHDIEWYAGDTWKFRRNLTLSYGFRWSFYRQPYSQTNNWASFSLADYNPALPASDACNGVIIVPGTSPCTAAATQLSSLGISLPLSAGTTGPNRALVFNNNHDIAPRLGLAWDVRGDGKTAVRLGLGQFYQRASVGQDEGLARTAPFVVSATDNRTLETPSPLSSPAVSPNAAIDPTNVTPNSWQWNVSVERELGRNTALQLGYVGNTGIHLVSVSDLNAVPEASWVESAFLNGGAQNALRPAGNFGTIAEFAKGGHASYHSLQALFRSRLSNFTTVQASYTYSHSISDIELDNSSGGISEEAFITPNHAVDKGNSSINRPQIFVANEVFYLPKFTQRSNMVQKTLGGWELNSIISIETGSSVGVFTNGANGACALVLADGSCATGFNSTLNSLTGNGYSNNNRPDIVAGVGCNSGVSGKQILNPNAFTLVGYTIGTVGNAPHGFCFGPDNRNVDMQLAKNWIFKEHYRLKFSMDFFNVFNHANFFGGQNGNLGINFSGNNLVCGGGATPCSPTNNVVTGQTGSPNGSGSGFGQATSVHPGRELQYTLKFTF